MIKGLPKLAALAVAGLLAVATPALPQTVEQPLKLKGQSSHPASSNFHLLFATWAENVQKMTGGRVQIEALPAGAIVPPFEVFDATSRGVLEVGASPFGYILGKSLAGCPIHSSTRLRVVDASATPTSPLMSVGPSAT
jgi:TRAP-type mannitol/chloroaromatic compound transport system substrate-binding protein